MGREIKRVPVDFDWPLNKVWQGYLMPDTLHEDDCQACGGRGETPARLWLVATAHMLLLLEDDLTDQERGRPMHPYFNDYYTTAYGTRPSPDISDVIKGLLGERYRGRDWIGHDAIDGWVAAAAVIRAAGLDPDTWGICQDCGGHGSTEKYPGQRADAEAWEGTEPPTGESWQLWETVSEGSPISPVFAERGGLVAWLCSPAYTWGASSPLTREQAEKFVESAWAPTFVGTSSGIVPGERVAGGA